MAPAGPLGQRKLRRATVSRATSSKVGGDLLGMLLGGFLKWWVFPPKWMVKIRENHIRIR